MCGKMYARPYVSERQVMLNCSHFTSFSLYLEMNDLLFRKQQNANCACGSPFQRPDGVGIKG